MTQQGNKQFSLSSIRRHYSDPHGIYNALRTHDSIYFDRISECWLVTGYTPIVTILGDPRFSSNLPAPASLAAPTSFLHAAVSKQMVFMDGEAHQQAQKVILRPLARLVKQMPGDIHTIVNSLLETACEKREVDIVQDFAGPLSLQVIARVLGLPGENLEELLQLERWSDTFGNITSGYVRGDVQDIDHLVEYFRALIQERRRAFSSTDDLLAGLIKASEVFPGDEDLIANCIMVFGAGRATVKKLLGNGIPILLQHWQRLHEMFQQNPLLPRLLGEELLRMVTPTRYLIRQANEEVDLAPVFPGNHTIRRGERVMLFLEAGNYDSAQFTQPASFDPHRRPNKHIAFGFGAHQCPGATLARMEIQIALEKLLAFTELQPKAGNVPVWNPNPNLGGCLSFNVVISQ